MFLFGLDLGTLWPIFLVIGGLAMLLGWVDAELEAVGGLCQAVRHGVDHLVGVLQVD